MDHERPGRWNSRRVTIGIFTVGTAWDSVTWQAMVWHRYKETHWRPRRWEARRVTIGMFSGWMESINDLAEYGRALVEAERLL